MWDKRYATPEYVFGTDPAAFLVAQVGHLPPGGRVLCVADGEGRNSVWLAQQGFHVTAFDSSPVAVEKARALAAERGVTVDVHVADVAAWDWPGDHDAVVAVFVQFAPPPLRAEMFAGMATALRPGGVLALHGYAPRQVGYGTGGPPVAENMYTLDLLRAAFPGWEERHAADYDAVIEEGAGHSGRSGLIDFVAVKP